MTEVEKSKLKILWMYTRLEAATYAALEAIAEEREHLRKELTNLNNGDENHGKKG